MFFVDQLVPEFFGESLYAGPHVSQWWPKWLCCAWPSFGEGKGKVQPDDCQAKATRTGMGWQISYLILSFTTMPACEHKTKWNWKVGSCAGLTLLYSFAATTLQIIESCGEKVPINHGSLKCTDAWQRLCSYFVSGTQCEQPELHLVLHLSFSLGLLTLFLVVGVCIVIWKVFMGQQSC